jgi:hypothetical protein
VPPSMVFAGVENRLSHPSVKLFSTSLRIQNLLTVALSFFGTRFGWQSGRPGKGLLALARST